MRVVWFIFLFTITVSFCVAQSKDTKTFYIDLSKFDDGIHHWNLYSSLRSEKRLDTTNIVGIANNLIAYQNTDGGWPKNIDWLAELDSEMVLQSLEEHYRESTFDNRNIFSQVEYLAAVYKQTGRLKYKVAAKNGFKYILDTEYHKGGWRGWDANVITFNDDVMTGIMDLLLDVKEGRQIYDWVAPAMRLKLDQAYDRGLSAILKSQVVLMGKKTAWCQQHDFDTYAPVQGRPYEHPSVTARESCAIIIFLMRIENPNPEVYTSIEAAVQWLESAKIEGYRYGDFSIEERKYHETTIDFDREFVLDSKAEPVWARYYDMKEGKPFLSLRNGTLVYNLSDIPFDRRVGYEWYGFWPNEVLMTYKTWKLDNPNSD